MANRIGVLLDPGHIEGYNIGAIRSYAEGTKVFQLAYYLKAELEKYDTFEVFVTRKNVKENPDLATRGKMAIKNNCQVMLSLHTNGFSSPVYGTVLYRSVARPEGVNLGNKLTACISDLIKKDVPKNYRRDLVARKNSSGTDYYGVLRHSVSGSSVVKYSYIIEHAFHSTYDECNWLNQDANLRKLAVVEAKCLADYFGAKLKGTVTPPTPPAEEKYINYTVVKGDNLSKIALKFYGNANKYPEIMKYNNLKSDVIYAKQILKIPNISSGTVTPPVAPYRNYTVKNNDSFWKIAANEMKDGNRYKELASYNKMEVTHVIHPGDILKIPN